MQGTSTPTRTPGTSLGGVADYPNVPPGGGTSGLAIALMAGAALLGSGGVLLLARRRIFS
jgi:hypothetical protein